MPETPKEFFKILPEAIKQAAAGPRGIVAMLCLITAIIAVIFFSNESLYVKTFVFKCFVTLTILASIIEGLAFIIEIHSPQGKMRSLNTSPEDTLFRKAREYHERKQLDQARKAYEGARILYKDVDDRRGEANVLRGLGQLEYQLGHHGQARENYHQAAHIYESLGMNKDKEYVEAKAAAIDGE